MRLSPDRAGGRVAKTARGKRIEGQMHRDEVAGGSGMLFQCLMSGQKWETMRGHGHGHMTAPLVVFLLSKWVVLVFLLPPPTTANTPDADDFPVSAVAVAGEGMLLVEGDPSADGMQVEYTHLPRPSSRPGHRVEGLGTWQYWPEGVGRTQGEDGTGQHGMDRPCKKR